MPVIKHRLQCGLRADLEIVERYHHSFPIATFPLGLMLRCHMEADLLEIIGFTHFYQDLLVGDNVYVEIYGEKFPNNGEYHAVLPLNRWCLPLRQSDSGQEWEVCKGTVVSMTCEIKKRL